MINNQFKILGRESYKTISKQKLFSSKDSKMICPGVIANADGIAYITNRALLDTGAGSLYISFILKHELNKSPMRKGLEHIETLLQTTNTMIDVFDVEYKHKE